MFNTLLRMWKKRKITEAKLREAVAKKWITEEECEIILATPQDPE